ncbi:ABC transporter [miscellaneous Crenarchaeota group archaeon SMTZ-80]|nr:MAG: ABC transporter [miscellaneous Crenarchaeota group archaeon SMTZ-80]
MSDVIVVEGLWKKFLRYHHQRTRAIAEIFTRGLQWIRPVEHFWALRDISFRVSEGQTLGVIGPNGSGKTTLLRLVGGVLRPDKGRIHAPGRIGALLELGTGFHLDLTGRENVFISGVIYGFTRREITQRFESIVAFAGLEDFIDKPLRSYSSGMQMRLAFSVAVHTEPDILLIDEVLAVGDLAFQYKCLDRIAEFKKRGCALIFVSHDLSQIRQHCDHVLWLRSGSEVEFGDAEEVATRYFTEMSEETRKRTPADKLPRTTSKGAELRINENRFGSMEMEIKDVRFLDRNGFPTEEIHSGDPLTVDINYWAPQSIISPIFVVKICDPKNREYFDADTTTSGLILPVLEGEGSIYIHLDRLDLNGGRYFVDVGVYDNEGNYAYDYHWHVHKILIHSLGHNKGVLASPFRWEFRGKRV